jgi:glycosyltransferase involved in cell wall biosynthesis
MNKKTIVMVLPDLKGNGAERVIMTLADGFIEKDCNVHVILFSKFIELKSKFKFQIHVFEKHYRWIPKSIRGAILAPLLDRFIKKKCSNPDLVLSNLLPVDRILCKSKLNNVFLVIHNTPSYDFFQGLSGRILSNQIDRFSKIYKLKPSISVSKGVKENFDSFFKNKNKSYQIYNPIDTEFISNLASQYNTISDYIIHVGKFKNQKRHDILIKSYAKSKIKERLVLVGQGPLQDKSIDLVKNLKIEDKVIFTGFQSNPYPYMKNAKFMVLSSEFEGLGMVILESLALNTPVISTDCDSGPREILPEENLVPINDVNALANKISAVSDNTANYSCNIRKEFLLENVVKEYIKLIN